MQSYLDQEFKNYTDTLATYLQKELAEAGFSEMEVKVNFEKIKDFSFGHLTLNTALQYSKILKTNPMSLAEKLANILSEKEKELENKTFKKISVAAPGFVNLTLTTEFFTDLANNILHNKNYGENELEKNKVWAIEHTSPNPNKAMHIGHLRNNLVGMSLSNLLESCGAKVTKEAIMNDRGIAIAKLMYGYLYGQIIPDTEAVTKKSELSLRDFIHYWTEHRNEWQTPQSLETEPDLFTSQSYIFGEEFMNEKEAEVRQLVIDWEAGDTENHELWKHVLSFSYLGMNKTLKRLGSSWDKVWYESEHYKEGKDLVEEGLQKKIFTKLEDGAVLTNLEKYNLPDTILQKRDGTSLYITQDLALTRKKKEFNKADKMVWVVGPDQSLAMKQVFACCEQLGLGKLEDFWHISYGYVGLADADGSFVKMSSRKGNVLLIDDLIDLVRAKLLEQMRDVDTDRAEKLALAAIKFAILKSGKDESLTFDIDKSVDTKGDTGVYVMYTLARIRSILDKVEDLPEEFVNNEIVKNICEKTPLLRTLFFYPQSLEKSLKDKSTHHVAQHLLELCSAFNSLYEQEKIIDDEDLNKNKLLLAKNTEQVILHGLSVLNIKPVFKI